MAEAVLLQERVARNLDHIRLRMAEAARRSERSPDSVTLIAITKSVGVEEIQALHALGVRDFGENRPEDSLEKVSSLPVDSQWHMIGNLQRRKAKVTVERFQCIDAVDRPELFEALQARCEELDVSRRVLIEVNVSGEASKHGVTPDDLEQMLALGRSCSRLKVEGLLTMAPFGAEESVLRQVFARLRRLAEAHGLSRLSMGMTDDFEIAIEEGATEVRIGRALFE